MPWKRFFNAIDLKATEDTHSSESDSRRDLQSLHTDTDVIPEEPEENKADFSPSGGSSWSPRASEQEEEDSGSSIEDTLSTNNSTSHTTRQCPNTRKRNRRTTSGQTNEEDPSGSSNQTNTMANRQRRSSQRPRPNTPARPANNGTPRNERCVTRYSVPNGYALVEIGELQNIQDELDNTRLVVGEIEQQLEGIDSDTTDADEPMELELPPPPPNVLSITAVGRALMDRPDIEPVGYGVIGRRSAAIPGTSRQNPNIINIVPNENMPGPSRQPVVRSHSHDSGVTNTDGTDENTEMVPIGSGSTMVPMRIYSRINWNSYTMATRRLLMAVFPRRVLATHTLRTPVVDERPPQSYLNERKIADIIQTVVKNCKVITGLVRHAISTKCSDERKMHLQKIKNMKERNNPNPGNPGNDPTEDENDSTESTNE